MSIDGVKGNPKLHIPTLGSSNSAANTSMMSKIWTNGDTVICLSRNIVGKREIACHEAVCC